MVVIQRQQRSKMNLPLSKLRGCETPKGIHGPKLGAKPVVSLSQVTVRPGPAVGCSGAALGRDFSVQPGGTPNLRILFCFSGIWRSSFGLPIGSVRSHKSRKHLKCNMEFQLLLLKSNRCIISLNDYLPTILFSAKL